jgi:hypothetical protein
MDGDHVNTAGRVPWARVRLRTWVVARRVRAMERRVDVVVCHPAYAQFLRRPFVNWLAIGMPVDADDASSAAPAGPADREGPLVVLHAPTRVRQKGTGVIEAAVERLLARGVDVSFGTLTGLTNAEVRRRLRGCDVAIDQLYSDTLLAGLGAEAGSAGAQPLVFGYAGALLGGYAERLGLPHEHYAHPEQLERQLERAVRDPRWRAASAEAVQRYVREDCSPERVAGKLARVIDGDVPPEWYVDPASTRYLLGYGMPQDLAEDRLREYVRRFGERALCLPPDGAALRAVRETTASDRQPAATS